MSQVVVIANMAYGKVTLKSVAGVEDGRVYENPDKILGTGASTRSYEPTHSGKPEASEYASMEDTLPARLGYNQLIIEYFCIMLINSSVEHVQHSITSIV